VLAIGLATPLVTQHFEGSATFRLGALCYADAGMIGLTLRRAN